MSQTTFPNGQTLISSALTPAGINAIFQPLLAQILGIDPVQNPDQAYDAVRISWPTGGQLGWAITDDICFIRATADDDAFSQVRDEIYQPKDSTSLTKQMGFTQTWGIRLLLYGPNSYDRARLISSAMSLDWVHDALAASNLYAIPEWHRPERNPELYQGQWWDRSDLELKFYEQVSESLVAPAAASVDVTALTDTGQSSELTVSAE